MKKFYCQALLAMTFFASSAMAMELTPQQAFQAAVKNDRAASIMERAPRNVTPFLTKKAAGKATVYLFNSENGLILASAESDTPALLGYSETPLKNVGELPEGVAYWIDYYSNEIQQYREGKVIRRVADNTYENFETISPYLTTYWDQAAPYDNMCPTLDGQQCVVGCVATAMAQAMKYYNWPSGGSGSISYEWKNGQQTLSTDFSQSVYNWNLMLNNYWGSPTKEQEDAVALLNKDCGYAVKMNYSPTASGAYARDIAPALFLNFGYDRGMRFEQRENFYTEDWIKLVYEDVAALRPVIYCGSGEAGGHCFLCDGYSSDGYFHFNWGWGGTSNGYFRLSALAPGIQGIGGNNGNFNSAQSIVFGMMPAKADSKLGVVIAGYSGISPSEQTYTSGSIHFDCDEITNYSVEALTGVFGVKLVPTTGSPIYVQGEGEVTLSTLNGDSYELSDYSVPFGNFPTSGDYTVLPAFFMDGQWYDVETNLSYPYSLRCEIADGIISFRDVEAPSQLEIDNFKVTSEMYSGIPFSVSFDASDPGTKDFYGDMRLALVNEDYEMVTYSSIFTIDISSGETAEQNIVTEFVNAPDPGTYILALINNYGLVYYEEPVTVGTVPAGNAEVELSGLTIANAKGTTLDSAGNTVYEVNPADVRIEGTVTCTDGYLHDSIEAFIFPPGGGTSIASLGTSFNLLSAGSSAPLTINGSFRAADNTQLLIAFFLNQKQVPGLLYIVTDNESGIKAIQASELQYTIEGDTLIINGIDGKTLTRILNSEGLLVAESNNSTIDISELKGGVFFIVVTDGTTARTAKILR